MRVVVLASGSSGNAVVVESSARVLLDAGIGPRALERTLAASGLDPSRPFDGIVATHEHGDHFGGAEKLARALGCPVFAHDGITGARLRRRHDVRPYEIGRPFCVGDLELTAVTVPHDAPQVALRVATPDFAVGYATDVGRVTDALVDLLGACDAALVEANHCTELLRQGPYPPHLKARISSGLGHLSNREVADLAARLEGSRLRGMLLGHVSRANNTADRALATVRARAPWLDVDLVEQGEVRELRRPPPAAPGARARAWGQLALPFGPVGRAGHSRPV